MLLKIPYQKQVNDYFCGPATLAKCLEYYGKNITQHELAHLAGTSPHHGTTNKKMVRTIKKIGLKGIPRKKAGIVNRKTAIKNRSPIIVKFVEPEADIDHFAVIMGFEKNKIFLSDPWHGPKFEITQEEFLKRWKSKFEQSTRWMLEIKG